MVRRIMTLDITVPADMEFVRTDIAKLIQAHIHASSPNTHWGKARYPVVKTVAVMDKAR
jgi:hypothetical protein